MYLRLPSHLPRGRVFLPEQSGNPQNLAPGEIFISNGNYISCRRMLGILRKSPVFRVNRVDPVDSVVAAIAASEVLSP